MPVAVLTDSTSSLPDGVAAQRGIRVVPLSVRLGAREGQEGVDILESTPDIDIVLMDIMMPIMDGYDTMRAMRRLTPTDDLPIIAVTAAVEAGERQRCIDAGATAYVTKPVDTASLLLVLGEWLPSDLPAGEPPAVVG